MKLYPTHYSFLISEPRNENNQHIYIRINMHIKFYGPRMNLAETWWGSLLTVTVWAEIELTAAKMKKKEENPETKNAFICQPLISQSLTQSVTAAIANKPNPISKIRVRTKKTKKDSNFHSLITPPIVSDDEAKMKRAIL